jgi:hypothetical protein
MEYKHISWPAMFSHIVQEHIIQGVTQQHMGAFSPDLFKTKWLNNKRSIQNIYRNKKFLKDLKLPSYTISYEINDDPRDTLFHDDFPYNYGSHYIAGPFNTFYWRIFFNPINKIQIYTAFIRKKITFTIQYLFPDNYLRDDVYTWMLNTFRYAGPPAPFGSNMSIYAAIPNNMLEYLSAIQSYDLTNIDCTKQYANELMQFSGGLFRERKITLADTLTMWFLVYQLPDMKLIQTDKPEKSEGELRGQTKSRYGITETLEIEPFVPQMFITKTPHVIHGKRVPDSYKMSVHAPNDIDPRIYNTRNMVVDPIPGRYNNSHTIIANIEFCVPSNTEEEIITIDTELLGEIHQKVINILKTVHRDVNDYYQIDIFAFNTPLVRGADYDYNFEMMHIIIKNTNINYIYRLVVVGISKLISPYVQNIMIHL